MAAVPVPGDNPTASEPVACSLGRADLADQARRWTRLAARAMTGHQQTADGVRVGFRPGPGTEEELRALVAVETRCCPWAAWTVHADATELVLDVRSANEGIAALHAMFTGLRPAPVPRQAGRPR